MTWQQDARYRMHVDFRRSSFPSLITIVINGTEYAAIVAVAAGC
jgi:hypothetical protein